MKEKVEAGDNEPLDMLIVEILKGDVFDGSLLAPFIMAARIALRFLA
jgi:hypothetical protein